MGEAVPITSDVARNALITNLAQAEPQNELIKIGFNFPLNSTSMIETLG